MDDLNRDAETSTSEHVVIENILPTSNENEMKDLMRNLDREHAYREHKCWRQYITVVVSVCFCLFQLYATLSGAITAQILRATHLAFVQLLAFLLFPATKKSPKDTLPWYDVVLGLLGAACWMYIVINFQNIVRRAGMYQSLDVIVAVAGILILFESCRRIVGLPIMIIAACFILYAFVGRYLPGFLNHRGYSLERVATHLFYNTEGIMGTPIGACSTFIFLFILFGALLEKTGIGQFFIDICNSIAGGASGGPAKVAVLTSALLGTVSGSSVSNTVGSGSFTIPMMKKLGYKSEFAGAVEAAASTGGQLMPPVMGAAAFLMAEFVGVPYFDVVKAAVIPAMLYYIGVWLGVHYEAKKFGLKGTPRDQLPKFKELFLEKGHLAIPLIVIVYLLVSGYTPMRAALAAIVLTIVCACLRKSTRIGFKQIVQGLIDGSKGVLGVLIACATAGIIIGVVTKTGVGLKIATALLDLAGGNLLPAMFFTMITSLILGMGVPTTANYVITSTIAAPALVQMNVPVLAAHMFAFYFGIVADVTPPVALAAYAGAGIAGANPMRTGVIAAKLAIAAFIVPYIFVLAPELLMINATPFTICYSAFTAIVGMWGASMAMIGFCNNLLNIPQRILFLVGGICMIIPGVFTDGIGVALVAVAYVWQRMNKVKGAIQQDGEDL